MYYLCFLPEVFIVSGLTSKSLICFEFIFVCGVRKESHLILLHVTAVFPTPFIEEVDFPPLYILAPIVVDELPIKAWVHFWALYCVPLTYDCFSSPVLDQPSNSFFFSPPSDKEAAPWRPRRQAGFPSIRGYWHTLCASHRPGSGSQRLMSHGLWPPGAHAWRRALAPLCSVCQWIPCPFDGIRLIQCGLQGPASLSIPPLASPFRQPGLQPGCTVALTEGLLFLDHRTRVWRRDVRDSVWEVGEGPSDQDPGQRTSERKLTARWRRASLAFGFYL